MDYGNINKSSMHGRLGSATLSQLAFPEESDPNFLWEKSQWDNRFCNEDKTINTSSILKYGVALNFSV